MRLPIYRPTELPRRFPLGAKYVVEGCGADSGSLRVIARYVLLPSGRRINVPPELPLPTSRALPFRRTPAKPARSKGRTPAIGKKFAARHGTSRPLPR
ncbi:MAG: hypothetical protein KGQ47_07535 [Hyphomicrobiales bacterium]|nr:hypothetical protein [Hyphomicrobiales bacterium]MDE2374089.1 hypothetical protein [Hyphomicrobiales bacterium]